MPKAEPPSRVRDGDHCVVISGTHAGKAAMVEDVKTSKTGHVTLTVRAANGERVKTLARNVAAGPAPAKKKRPAR